MYFLNSHIVQLHQYLNIFQTCVLHLINYQGIHIPPVQFPLILSRHEVIFPQSISTRGPSFFFVRKDDPHRFTYESDNLLNETLEEYKIRTKRFKLSISAQQRNWNCLTRFYIFPPKNWPQPDIHEEDFSVDRVENLFNAYDPIRVNCFPRTGYHILIPNPVLDFDEVITSWSYLFNRLLRKNELLEMLVTKTKLSLSSVYSSGPIQIQVTQILACCRYCARFSPTFFKISDTNEQKIPNLTELQLLTKTINRNGFSVPIYVASKGYASWTHNDLEAVRKTR